MDIDPRLIRIFANGTQAPTGVVLDGEVVLELTGPLDVLAEASSDIPNTTSASSPFMQIPNFLQAILTLIICGLLLAASLLIIRKCKDCCTRHKTYYDEENQGEQMVVSEPESPDVVEQNSGGGGPSEMNLQASNVSGISSRSSSRNSQRSGKIPIPRRTSGPFGEEALAHAAETYKRDNKEYEDKVSSWARRVSTRRVKPPREPTSSRTVTNESTREFPDQEGTTNFS